MTNTNVNTIWNGWNLIDEEYRNGIRECMLMYDGITSDKISEEDIDALINDYLEDERANLNVEVDGIIIAYADLGLWDGHHKGIKIFKNNVSEILYSDSDYPHWYTDRYNVRATMPHHDGTNYILYRVAKDRETAERIMNNILYKGKGEDYFKRNTKSLRPYVAEVYGW